MALNGGGNICKMDISIMMDYYAEKVIGKSFPGDNSEVWSTYCFRRNILD